MPTYDYVCTKCGNELELFQSMKDAPVKRCPKCGKPGLKRLLGSGAGLIFKGSGFYVTDYKKKSGSLDGAKAGGDKSPAPTPAKTETKAASK